MHSLTIARPGDSRPANRCFTRKQRRYLSILAGGVCQQCGTSLNGILHGDHIKPYCKGGSTTLANGQALCPTCNLKKGAKDVQ